MRIKKFHALPEIHVVKSVKMPKNFDFEKIPTNFQECNSAKSAEIHFGSLKQLCFVSFTHPSLMQCDFINEKNGF